MDNPFFEKPILNSPYEYPARHWELDAQGQPTQRIVESRRGAEFLTPISKPKKRKQSAEQLEMVLPDEAGVSSQEQQYATTATINELRREVDRWRMIEDPNAWQVTPEIGAPAPALAPPSITDQDLLREVMNTVGKPGRLGESSAASSRSRCSPKAGTPTRSHTSSVSAPSAPSFSASRSSAAPSGASRTTSTRRACSTSNTPTSSASPSIHGQAGGRSAPAAPPDNPGEGHAPGTRPLEIRFPRVAGYRVELPEERLTADFNEDSILELTPDLVGPSKTRNRASSAKAWT